MSAAPTGPVGPVVDVDTLRSLLADDGVAGPVLLDVRWFLGKPDAGIDAYDEGHVPGAVFVDLDTELAGRPGRAGRHPLPDPDALEETLRRAGVRQHSVVVAYDGGDGMAAARAWWVLRWAGLAPGRVAVLDGGFPAWVAAGGEVTTAGGGVRAPGDVGVGGGAMPVLSADDAAALAAGDHPGGRSSTLLDARSPERFRGETEPIDPAAGHVPGAANLPAASLLDADGRWRSPDELAQLFGDAAVGDTVAAYCGSGVSAAMLVLALERAGVRDPEHPAGLYVGSWSHWTAAKRPIETGPARSG